MKIKEVQAGVKIVKNYNSYHVNMTAELDDGENPEAIGEILIERASKIILDNVNSGDFSTENLAEVGAAWPSKKFNEGLSVKISKTGKWEDVKIEDLEKTADGYKQKTDDGILIFRKISDDKRTNGKMPMFRIYKMGGRE